MKLLLDTGYAPQGSARRAAWGEGALLRISELLAPRFGTATSLVTSLVPSAAPLMDATGTLVRHELAHPCLGGTGYPRWRREELVDLYLDPATRQHVPRSNRRSVKRWIRRFFVTHGTLHRDPLRGGRKRRITDVEIGLCHIAKRARPTLNADEVSNFVATMTGRAFSRVTVSRSLLSYGSYGAMSRMSVQQEPRERDTLRRVLWRLRAPPLGHAGVPSNDMLDVDECAIYVTSGNRTFGHAYVGERAVEVQRYEPGHRFSLLMAAGRRHGDVYFVLYENENVDSEKFSAFLEDEVFPHCGPARTLMWDNLAAHLTAQVLAVVAHGGHRALPRPPYSPDLAPIEYIFGLIQARLKKYQFSLNEGNLRQYLRAAIQLAVTPANVAAIFDHCGY